jgi:hypothetical protein
MISVAGNFRCSPAPLALAGLDRFALEFQVALAGSSSSTPMSPLPWQSLKYEASLGGCVTGLTEAAKRRPFQLVTPAKPVR